MVKVLIVEKANIALPPHIKKFLKNNGGVSTILRALAIDYYRKSNLTEIRPEGHWLKIEKVDLDSNSIHILLDDSIIKALGTKAKKVVVQL